MSLIDKGIVFGAPAVEQYEGGGPIACSGGSGTDSTLNVLGDGSCTATYQLNSNTNNLAGGSASNNGVSWTTGTIGNCGEFVGGAYSGDYLSGVTNVAPSNYAVSFWMKPSGSSYMDNFGSFNAFWVTGNTVVCHPSNDNQWGNSDFYGYPGNEAWKNKWVHVAITVSGNVPDVYVNANKITRPTKSEPGGAASRNTGWIGGSYWFSYNYYYMNALLDQVRLFNSSLTTSEISTLYAEGCSTTWGEGTINTVDVFGDSSGIALYNFTDATFNDKSTNYNASSYDCSVTSSGISWKGAYFDGGTTYTYAGWNYGTFPLFSNGYSMSLWVYIYDDGTSGSIWTSGYDENRAGFNIYHGTPSSGSCNIAVLLSDGSSGNGNQGYMTPVSSGSNSVTTGAWHHIVVSVPNNGSNAELYIDNVLASEHTGLSSGWITKVWGATSYATSQMGFGKQFGYNSDYAKMRLDQVRIFNKPLTANNVYQLYEESNFTQGSI